MNLNDFLQLVLFILVLVLVFVLSGSGFSLHKLLEGFGTKPLVKYYIFESDLDPIFTNRVVEILNASKVNDRYTLSRVTSKVDADMTIALAKRSELDSMHDDHKHYYPDGKQIRFSFTTMRSGKPEILIDDENWLKGVNQSGLTLDEYQRYVIQHEFLHALGFDHQTCEPGAESCPIMHQSTRGCPAGTKCGFEITEQDYKKRISGWRHF